METSGNLICKHQGDLGVVVNHKKGVSLTGLILAPTPATASPAVPPYRHRLVDRVGLENLWR